MNFPGHDCSIEEFFSYVFRPKFLTLEQIDLATKRGRSRFFNKTLRKYTDEEIKQEYDRRELK